MATSCHAFGCRNELGSCVEAMCQCILVTRNMHVHLCLVPVCRLCTRGTCYVCCRPRRSCLVFVVTKPRWPRCTVIPDLHLHCQRALSSTNLSELSISECVRLCDTHYGLYLWHVTTFRVTFLSMTHHVRTYIRTL